MRIVWMSLFGILIVFLVIGILLIHSFQLSLQKKIISSPGENLAKNQKIISVSKGANPNIGFKIEQGFTIHVFASGLSDPRDLQFSPGGTLLVSEPNLGRVIALPDKNSDGKTDSQKIVISGENHPHGLAFFKNKLYVADVDRVVSYTWNEKSLTASDPKILFNLPENGDHNNRSIVFDKNGNMFVSVGSTCNVCHESSPLSATIITASASGENMQIFATGLRNAAFMQFNPNSNQLWATENGRDYLGDNTPPDEINIIESGANYGWPNCYGNKIPDTTFNPNAICTNTQSPVYELPAHSAPLGLLFINSPQFPPDWQSDLLVALHGSWNRSIPIGYKIVHLKIKNNQIIGSQDFLSGFLPNGALNGPNDALGRPVDLTFDKNGSLYLSDDKGGFVYIIQHP